MLQEAGAKYPFIPSKIMLASTVFRYKTLFIFLFIFFPHGF
ncbi:hypothetical protein RchiOBHm_Chr2g0165101 [Rosa chinensis]|uniref:Uncharacterized protein n=1 Tax=Rosa chinensis TaxID=74649 RepID=A0A2P6S3Q9_ROSCH|nr:hypothetical protein RchiOBHm_Chr2g0165101 [Rosa chinensis]